MRDMSELGIEQTSAVDDRVVEAVQRQLGVRLPEEFIIFVRYNDEAQPLLSAVEFGGEKTVIDSFFKFTDDKNEGYGILSYSGIPGLPKKVVPFARDPGDGFFCIDMNMSGKIVFYDPATNQCAHVADSFGDFIDSLSEP